MHPFEERLRVQYSELRMGVAPDMLVGVPMGAFVEFFFEDAEIVSNALGIVLTNRGKHFGADVPMCGLSSGALEGYLSRLSTLGIRVQLAAVVDSSEGDDDVAGTNPFGWLAATPRRYH